MLITSRSGKGGRLGFAYVSLGGGVSWNAYFCLLRGGGGLKSPENGLRNKRMAPNLFYPIPTTPLTSSRSPSSPRFPQMNRVGLAVGLIAGCAGVALLLWLPEGLRKVPTQVSNPQDNG